MARLFTDGAEMGDVLFFDSASNSASTVQKRTGSYSYVINNNNALKNIPNLSEFYIRFGMYIGSSAGTVNFISWRKGTVVLGSLRIDGTGKFTLYVGTTLVATGTATIQYGVFNLLEFHIKIADSGGAIEMKVNGLPDATFTGDTKPGTDTYIDNLYFVSTSITTTFYIDDIAINDTTGAVDNSWCGDGHVIALVPNANGDLSQLTGSDGNTTDNYLLVDETPSNSDTDYVEGSTVGEKDLYNLAASGLSTVNISRVWGEARSKDTTTAGGLLAITLKTEGVEYDSGDIALTTNYAAVKGPEYLVNPQTGIAWTITELDALQVGPKTRS